MKTVLLVLVCLGLFAPTAVAASHDLVAEQPLKCRPHPTTRPVGEILCCFINGGCGPTLFRRRG